MAHGVKLDTLSLEDLTSLIADAQKALSEKVDTKRQELQKQLAELDAISRPVKSSQSDGDIKRRPPKRKEFRHPESGKEYANTSVVPNEFKKLGVMTKEDMEQYRIK